jgi:hypothetical protein
MPFQKVEILMIFGVDKRALTRVVQGNRLPSRAGAHPIRADPRFRQFHITIPNLI